MAIALARRGGAKHRKNSPQVTVFSQSGEVAVLRAGREYDPSVTVHSPATKNLSPQGKVSVFYRRKKISLPHQ